MSALPPSLWAASAPAGPATPPLAGAQRADVAIVGGGITGLAAALRLAERGVRAAVLEAGEPGWGASGRAGGQVIPGLKHDPDELEAMFGREAGARLVTAAGSAPDLVFALIARHRIDCDAVRRGWIQPARNQAAIAMVEQRAAQWIRRGADAAVLGRDAVQRLLGTTHYSGGWIDRRAGSVQPLAYSRGLARAALAAGAAVFGATRVTALVKTARGWRVDCGNGTLEAERVLLATNGYTDGLWPGLARTVIAANSFQIASAPLPDALRRTILPNGEVASDARRLLLYFRFDRDGRFIMGGRGPFREPRAPADFAHLRRAVARIFPQLRDVAWDHCWAGRVAITRDGLPHVHDPAPGITACLGYNGRGIAMATLLGTAIADHIAGGNDTLPLAFTRIAPIPLHGAHRATVSLLLQWYRLCDALWR